MRRVDADNEQVTAPTGPFRLFPSDGMTVKSSFLIPPSRRLTTQEGIENDGLSVIPSSGHQPPPRRSSKRPHTHPQAKGPPMSPLTRAQEHPLPSSARTNLLLETIIDRLDALQELLTPVQPIETATPPDDPPQEAPVATKPRRKPKPQAPPEPTPEEVLATSEDGNA